jgi:hypothetical protein
VNNCLNFNLTDLLCDDFLVVFTEDGEVLLNNYNLLCVANDVFVIVVVTMVTREVVGTIKVVKVEHTLEATVVVERMVFPITSLSEELLKRWEWFCG